MRSTWVTWVEFCDSGISKRSNITSRCVVQVSDLFFYEEHHGGVGFNVESTWKTLQANNHFFHGCFSLPPFSRLTLFWIQLYHSDLCFENTSKTCIIFSKVIIDCLKIPESQNFHRVTNADHAKNYRKFVENNFIRFNEQSRTVNNKYNA